MIKMAKGCEDGHVGNGVKLATLVSGDKTASKLVYWYYNRNKLC